MATKKQAAVNAVEDIVAEEQIELNEAPAAVKVDPWQNSVSMIVPRKPKGEDQQYYVCVNDRRYMIPANGQMQELPQPIAEVLQESLQAEYAADDFADHIPNRSGEQPQQHPI